MRRNLFGDGHRAFRDTVQRFFKEEAIPHYDEWEEVGRLDRGLFLAAGSLGLLGFGASQAYGGAEVDDFRYNAILGEEAVYAHVPAAGQAITLHNDICLPYFLDLATKEQKARWLPDITSGRAIAAIAMTEPDAGSDLAGIKTTARRDGDVYVVNGSKTFISNGINSDLIVVAATTDPRQQHRGLTLLVLERGMDGFNRGRNLDKIGLHGQDTAELYFENVRVPVANRLGQEGRGFGYLTKNLAQERLSIAVAGVAAARTAIQETVKYVSSRTAFGQSISSFQNTRFVLAECDIETDVAQTYVDRCIVAHNEELLTAADAARVKYFSTELQKRVVDRCLQFFGGYGYMREFPIARMYEDARVTTIYGGTSEIMRAIVAKDIGI